VVSTHHTRRVMAISTHQQEARAVLWAVAEPAAAASRLRAMGYIDGLRSCVRVAARILFIENGAARDGGYAG